ncbi:hypothetical protein M2134_002613 [Parabacteroides sp. PM6-13]|nr:hypothetical protein [Parabacteroides sp. PM6-13]
MDAFLQIGEKGKEKGEGRKGIGIEDRLAEGAEQIGDVGTGGTDNTMLEFIYVTEGHSRPARPSPNGTKT